jgi:hypothetical protein
MSAAATRSASPAPAVPLHWTPEQALAVFECLHAMREALWAAYGPAVQQAWRDQLVPDGLMPQFDPHEPF